MSETAARRRRALEWGGARNRADRVSHFLKERQCRQLIEAAQRTFAMGKGFNRFITISWELGGIARSRSVDATGRFITLGRDWFRERGEPLHWAWVQECGPILGAHCHILIHVPEELAGQFGVMPLRWVKRILPPNGHRGGVLDTNRWRTDYNDRHMREAAEARVMGKVHYMLKAAPEELMDVLGMTGWGHTGWGRTCPVIGKRLAIARNCAIL